LDKIAVVAREAPYSTCRLTAWVRGPSRELILTPCRTFRSESDEESPLDHMVAASFLAGHPHPFLAAAGVVTPSTVGSLVGSSTHALKSQLDARRPNRKEKLGNRLDFAACLHYSYNLHWRCRLRRNGMIK
jgi:hypothetical protein